MLTVVGAKRDIWFGLSPNRKWYRQCFSAALETLTKLFNVLCLTCANYGWLFKSNLEEPLYLLKRCTRPLTFAVTNNGLGGRGGKSEVTPKLAPTGFSPGESGLLPSPLQYIIHTPPSTLSQNCQNPFLATSLTPKSYISKCLILMGFVLSVWFTWHVKEWEEKWYFKSKL